MGLAGALLGLILALVVFAPARWVAALVTQGSGGKVALADVQGRVWQGHGELVLLAHGQRDVGMRLPGRVSWQLQPHWQPLQSWRPGLRLAVHAPCCMESPLNAQVLANWGGASWAVQDHQSDWPADLLAGLGTPWNTLDMQGILKLSLQGLSGHWAQGRLQWAGTLGMRAVDVSSRLSTLRPLGSYALTVQGGTAAHLSLQSLPGSRLQLAGSGQWVGGRLRFLGEASASASHEEALSNLLNIIGRRNGPRSFIQLG
jgi:general secretion pathway protein N